MPKRDPLTPFIGAKPLTGLAETIQKVTSDDVATVDKEKAWGVGMLKKVMDAATPLGDETPHVARLRKALQVAAAYYCYRLDNN